MISGAISSNLCKRRVAQGPLLAPTGQQKTLASTLCSGDWAKQKEPPITALDAQKKQRLVIYERALLINESVVLCILRTYNADNVKRTLFKEHIQTSRDWDVIAGVHIPMGFTAQLNFPLTARPVLMRIWPTLAFNTPTASVPWSVYRSQQRLQGAGNTEEEEMLILEAPESMTYVEFLLAYAGHHQARIDYTIFIYNKPLLMGYARVRDRGAFFFARILSCKEMLTHGLVDWAAISCPSLA